MESGISNGWEVIYEDEELELANIRRQNAYFRNPGPKIAASRKWDQAHPEKKREARRRYEQRTKRVPDPEKYRSVRQRYWRKVKRLKRAEMRKQDPRKKIMCIYGSSGSGKSKASYYLKKCLGANVICSCTTRPPRPREKNGVSHWFVKDVPPMEELLAYTFFGGNHYYARKSDVKGEVSVYVVDEAGINMLAKMSDEFIVFPVRIERKEHLRRRAGVTKERIERDRDRVKLEVRTFRVVKNNFDIFSFFREIKKVYNLILNY